MNFANFTTGVGVNVDVITSSARVGTNTRLFIASPQVYIDVPTKEWEDFLQDKNGLTEEVSRLTRSIIELKELLRARLH